MEFTVSQDILIEYLENKEKRTRIPLHWFIKTVRTDTTPRLT